MAALQISAQEFHQLAQAGKVVLVDYWAPWCVYCRRVAPAYDKIAEQFSDRLVVAKINIDEEPLLAAQEQIEVIPTLVLYKDGKALGSIVAPESKNKIEEFILSHL